MLTTLNPRGRLVVILTVILILLTILIRVPPLVLLSSLVVAYIITYPLVSGRMDGLDVVLTARLRHQIMYRGEPDILQMRIVNNSNEVIPLVNLDVELPDAIFAIESPTSFRLTLEPNQELRFNVPIFPAVRGIYEIGPIRLTIMDSFQIFETEVGRVESISSRIYPKRLGSTIAKTRSKRIFIKLVGFFATNIRGTGTDFHGLRDYIRGDPSKIVDWKATARANKLISKEFEEEKKLEVLIALASGSTMRGSKFDFMLGAAMDIYEGFLEENKPVGLVLFDNKVISEYKPSPSQKQKFRIWADIYGIVPRDVYADYQTINKWVDKSGTTNTLVIILGDLEGDFKDIADSIRDIRLRNNQVIFIDVWGYSFTHEQELIDAATTMDAEQYSSILTEVIGRGVKQYNIFRALDLKQEFARYKILYGYLEGPNDNIINALDRAMYSYYGNEWKAI